MAVEVVMPKLGMAMKEGTVSIWNKGVGDQVGKGEPIASVSSEKIEIDVESPAEGTVLKIAVKEGEGVPPGTVICYIGNPGEEITENLSTAQVQKPEVENVAPVTSSPEPKLEMTVARDRVKISPVARKMAEAGGIDIATINGTGPGGRITKEDVQEALKNARTKQEPQNKETNQLQVKSEEEVQLILFLTQQPCLDEHV